MFRSDTYGALIEHQPGRAVQHYSPSFFLWNSFARYRLIEKDKWQLSCFLRVRNVLDQRYYHITENSLLSLPTAPQDPIMVTLGASINLGRNRSSK